MREEIDIEELARWRRRVDRAVDGYSEQLEIDFAVREPEPEDWDSWFRSLREAA